MDITGIIITRDHKYTAYCDTGAFKEGMCKIWPEKPEFNCPTRKKDVCCIVCELLDNGCDTCCERINPDE